MFNITFVKKIYIPMTMTILLVVSSFCSAAIYKWTDEHGKVHYSNKRISAGESTTERLPINDSINLLDKVKAPKAPIIGYTDSKSPAAKEIKVESTAKKQKRSGKKIDHRCALAQNIISGKVKLQNGLDTGKHELKVAKRDIKRYCK